MRDRLLFDEVRRHFREEEGAFGAVHPARAVPEEVRDRGIGPEDGPAVRGREHRLRVVAGAVPVGAVGKVGHHPLPETAVVVVQLQLRAVSEEPRPHDAEVFAGGRGEEVVVDAERRRRHGRGAGFERRHAPARERRDDGVGKIGFEPGIGAEPGGDHDGLRLLVAAVSGPLYVRAARGKERHGALHRAHRGDVARVLDEAFAERPREKARREDEGVGLEGGGPDAGVPAEAGFRGERVALVQSDFALQEFRRLGGRPAGEDPDRAGDGKPVLLVGGEKRRLRESAEKRLALQAGRKGFRAHLGERADESRTAHRRLGAVVERGVPARHPAHEARVGVACGPDAPHVARRRAHVETRFAAGRRSGFYEDDAVTAFGEDDGGGEAGQTGADDENVHGCRGFRGYS